MVQKTRGKTAAGLLAATTLILGTPLAPAAAYPRPGKTETVSRAWNGEQAQRLGGPPNSSAPMASSNGRFVVFQSTADNLVRNDNNLRDDVFLRDRWRGTTQVLNANDG